MSKQSLVNSLNMEQKPNSLRGYIEYVKNCFINFLEPELYFPDNFSFEQEDLPYLNETITKDFVRKFSSILPMDKKYILLLIFIELSKVNFEACDELIRIIDIHPFFKNLSMDVLDDFLKHFDLELKWDYFEKSLSYDIILKIYKTIKPSEKETFVNKLIIEKLPKQINYSKRISNKKILEIIRENKKNINLKYSKLYQLGLIEIDEIPIEKFKCENIFNVIKTKKFPEISRYLQGKKENDDHFYKDFFAQSFPEDELNLLSKVLIINFDTLKFIPKNKENFLNYLKNIPYHSRNSKKYINCFNSNYFIFQQKKYNLSSIKLNYREFLGFNHQGFSFEECQEIFKDFFEKSIFNFNSHGSEIKDFENLFLILEKNIKIEWCGNINSIVMKLLNEIIYSPKEKYVIKCNFNLNDNVIKKIMEILQKNHALTYLYLKNNEKIFKYEFELQRVNYQNQVIQKLRHSFLSLPSCGIDLPIKSFKESFLFEFNDFYKNFSEKNNEEIKTFLLKLDSRERIFLLNNLVIQLYRINTNENKMEFILRTIKDFTLNHLLTKNIKDKIKLLDIDEKSAEKINEMKSSCKRKFEEVTENARNVLQKQNLEDDIKDTIRNLMDIVKKEIILEKIIEKPMIKCPIHSEYYEANNFYTLNCGHQILKNMITQINRVCPICRTKITSLSETLVQNDFDELNEQLSDF